MKQLGLLVSVLALVLVATSGAAFGGGYDATNVNGPYAFSLGGTSAGMAVCRRAAARLNSPRPPPGFMPRRNHG